MNLSPYLVDHLLEEGAGRHPGKVAIKQKERIITFRDLYTESGKMKHFLLEAGVERGDRVGILLDKSIEQLVAMFGISMAGGVFVFINPILKKEQIEYIIRDCQVKLLITSSAHHKKNGLSAPTSLLCVDDVPEAASPCWKRIKESLPSEGRKVHRIADDVACLIYTSGSTGLPKGVVVPHRTVVEGAEIVSTYLDITEEDRIISVLPFNFDYGLNQATSSVLKGATLVTHQFALPKDLLNLLDREKITGFAGMTPIWTKLFNERYVATAGSDFPHLRYITNSGGKVPRAILSRMRTFFPKTRIFLMYGLTEAFRSTYLPPEELDRHPDSVGKAIPNVEILVINNRGEECAPGEVGELVHRGALITKGYWNDTEKTKKVFRRNPLIKDQDHLNEIVVYSGDLVRKDEEGFLYFISRRDEMIKTSGYRVSPTEVEEVLVELSDVKNAVVFGKEIDGGDQVIVAVVETNGGSPHEISLMQECRKRLPGYMVPHEVHFESEFPRTANGKIDRSFLKQKWMGGKEN
jgi:acyl-CoA ligase (AMP-forming) (exosortase A-associated)